MLNMLDRNRKIKNHPEKFQLNNDVFNVILSCEERVYDQILDDFNKRKAKAFTQCHVINLDIPDNHEDADIGAIVFSQVNYFKSVNQMIKKIASGRVNQRQRLRREHRRTAPVLRRRKEARSHAFCCVLLNNCHYLKKIKDINSIKQVQIIE